VAASIAVPVGVSPPDLKKIPQNPLLITISFETSFSIVIHDANRKVPMPMTRTSSAEHRPIFESSQATGKRKRQTAVRLVGNGCPLIRKPKPFFDSKPTLGKSFANRWMN
jgi:hypothetical protein